MDDRESQAENARMLFRTFLLELSAKIAPSDLADLKDVVKSKLSESEPNGMSPPGICINRKGYGRADLFDCDTTLKFFDLMEKRGDLCENNVAFLSGVLESTHIGEGTRLIQKYEDDRSRLLHGPGATGGPADVPGVSDDRADEEFWADWPKFDHPTNVRTVVANNIQHQLNDQEVYNMKGKSTGMRVLIINNQKFGVQAKDTHGELGDRPGTNTDADNLEALFEGLGLKSVKRKNDCTAEDIYKAIKEAASNMNPSDNGFICCILSHGVDGAVYGTDGRKVRLEDIYDEFDGQNCVALKNQPKLFFIQACRGGSKDVLEADGGQSPGSTDQASRSGQKMPSIQDPSKAHFFVANATTSGYVAWRNPTSGTLFIRALVDVLALNSHKDDLSRMLTQVNQKVSQKSQLFKDRNGRDLVIKQVAETRSTLLKTFYFFPGYDG